jgi:hypothetical protein
MAFVMTMSPTAVRTAHRNLVQRIDRFVKRIQTEGFQPDPSALANFKVALESRWHVDKEKPASSGSGRRASCRALAWGRERQAAFSPCQNNSRRAWGLEG